MKRGLLGLVESAYRFDESPRDWLDTLSEVASELTPGTGAMVYAFDASHRPGVDIGPWGATGVSDAFAESTIELNRKSSDDEVDLFYRSGVTSGTVSEFLQSVGEDVAENESYDTTTGARGYPDTFGLTASAPDFRGLVINSPLATRTTLDERTRFRWRQVGAHLQTAYRLRRYVDSAFDDAEAVLEPDGRLVDASDGARDAERRSRLRDAVVAIDKARSGSDESDSALDVWSALVDGRWSLVESIDTDGRRFYLAIPNGCETRELFALTDRERQVVAHVAQGDSNKWCGYQLGVSPATVSTLLRRALDKLGLESRRELIVLYNRLLAGEMSSK
jgi:DNA-binding CsgD family transcriptional regulator